MEYVDPSLPFENEILPQKYPLKQLNMPHPSVLPS